MKVIALIGSPRKVGNTSKIVDSICKGLKQNGHSVEIYNLTNFEMKGCKACDACQMEKVDFCTIDDSITKLLPKIATADCIIFGTPIYVGHVSGSMKNLLDRMRSFLRPNRTVRFLPNKKYITVTCSSLPGETFKDVTEYLNKWLGGFFQMENIGNIIAGNLREKDAINNQPELLLAAENLGRQII